MWYEDRNLHLIINLDYKNESKRKYEHLCIIENISKSPAYLKGAT